MGKGTRQKKKPSVAKARRKAAIGKCPHKLKEGVVDDYGTLQKTTGDGTLDRDHIPSYKALEKRARFLMRRPLTKAEKARVKRRGKAIVLPKSIHKQGRTYGGKNTEAQTTADSRNLAGAASSDIAAYQGVASTSSQQAMQSMPMSNAEYDKMLRDAVEDN